MSNLVLESPTVAPNAKLVYAISQGYGGKRGWLDVLKAKSDTLVKRIQVKVSPSAVAVAPNNKTVYVTADGPTPSGSAPPPRGTVSVVSAATHQIVKTMKVGWYPSAAVVSPDGHELYVANSGAFDRPSSISVISTATNTVEHTITVPGVYSLAIDASGSRLYALDQYGLVSAISTATNQVLYSIQSASQSGGFYTVQVSVSPAGNRIYAMLDREGPHGWVVALRSSDGQLVRKTAVGNSPQQMVVAPDGKRVYVANTGEGDYVHRQHIAVISTKTNRVVASIRVGFAPLGLAISADSRTVFVANSVRTAGRSDSGGTVSVIDTAHKKVRQTLRMPSTDAAQYVATSPHGRHAFVTAESASGKASVTLLKGP